MFKIIRNLFQRYFEIPTDSWEVKTMNQKQNEMKNGMNQKKCEIVKRFGNSIHFRLYNIESLQFDAYSACLLKFYTHSMS